MLFTPEDPEDPDVARRGIEEARRAYAGIHAPAWTRAPIDNDDPDDSIRVSSALDMTRFYEACDEHSNRVMTERYVESHIPDSPYAQEDIYEP